MQAALDPLEWRLEVDAVYKELLNIEKDIELQRQRGAGVLDDEVEEYRRHLDMIIDCCQDIRNTSGADI